MNDAQLFECVNKHRALIFDAERFIWEHAETGYREWETSKYLENAFEALGYEIHKAGNIPGFYADVDTGVDGASVLVMAELDGLICAGHPEARPETGAAHACGHNAQCAGLLGLAAALKEAGVLDGLSGRMRLMLVPAEELIEIEYREGLRKTGVIRYFGGKPEFMWRGFMDGFDLAMMIHTSGGKPSSFRYGPGSNGCIVKKVGYRGVASHAGGSPENGINALYAATLGMQAINALRETFHDNDHIRVHPIITGGGDSVNVIPDDVRLESYTRGASVEAIAKVNGKVNRALAASAAALGARIQIKDFAGYLPRKNDKTLNEIMASAARRVVGDDNVTADGWTTGCSDMGDVSAVMPAIHPYVSGATGKGHGVDYCIADAESACVNAAKIQLLTLRELLKDGSAEAKRVVENFTPTYANFKEYFDAVDALMCEYDAVCYNDDGSITIRSFL